MGIRSQEQVALLTDYDIGTAYSQAYHTLYANIRFHWSSTLGKQHTLLLTTPSTYVGQATVATNVAITAAQSGTTTILVDADLRTPTMEQRFGLEKGSGLSNLLLEESITSEKFEQYLRKTFIPGLRLLSAGTAAHEVAATLLLSTKLQVALRNMCQYLEETESEPGMVIFNSQAVLAGPDASLIAALVEQTVLTIAKGRTTRTQAKRAQEQLQRAHANLAGIVLLDV